jgi:hypothetical protein
MSWRTNKRTGRHFRQKTIFNSPRNQRLAQEVRGSTLAESRLSVSELEKTFNNGDRAHKVEVYHATLDESNRLGIIAGNPRNGDIARRRALEDSHIFRSAADKMHRELYG